MIKEIEERLRGMAHHPDELAIQWDGGGMLNLEVLRGTRGIGETVRIDQFAMALEQPRGEWLTHSQLPLHVHQSEQGMIEVILDWCRA